MRTSLVLALLFALLSSARASGAAELPLKVVTTIPDLADLAREIGGDRVDVQSIAKGTMNVHAVPLKPSSLVAVNRADVFVQMGLSLEHTYVPGLLMKARNPAIQPGKPGFVNCSEGWEALDVPETLSRSQGADLHPLGNPHFNLDPRGGRHMADRILAGLTAVDPEGAESYRARHAAWVERYDAAKRRWDALGKRLARKRVVVYHEDFTYFLRYHGLDVVGTLEPKPGVPPTPRHLGTIVDRMREQDVRVVLTAKWSNNKSVRFVAEKTGALVVEGPVLVDGVPGADSWIEMMDVLHDRLAAALDVG